MEEGGMDAAVRKNLLDRLLNAVKQVQVHFGAKHEIATEVDLRVSALCVEWETALLHGFKKQKGARRLGKSEPPPSLWPLAKLCLSSDEVQRFVQLGRVTTDIGRGRAWLRSAINERTLENYLHTICAEEAQLRTYYDPHAFILDPECSSMLPNMAAGLGSIIFAIPIDEDYLNSASRSVDVPAPAVTLPIVGQTSLPVPRTSLGGTPSTGIFDPNSTTRGARAPRIVDNDDDDVVAISANAPKEKKKKRKKRSPYVSPRSTSPLMPVRATTPTDLRDPEQNHTPHQLGDEVELEREAEIGGASRIDIVGGAGGMASNLVESHSSSSSRLSLNSTNEEGQAPPTFVALDTTTVSHDNVTEAQAAADSMAILLSATGSHFGGMGVAAGVVSPQPPSRDSGGMSLEEMREAMLALVKAKDSLEERNKELESQVSELSSSRAELLSELEKCQSEMKVSQETHSNQLQALERENDLLREQLKKYVGMVQAQRRESSAKTTEGAAQMALSSSGIHTGSSSAGTGVESGLLGASASSSAEGGESRSPQRQASLEQRLSEMAEMYGEVMELNERLHKDIATKDKSMESMTARLRKAGLEASPISPSRRQSNATDQRKLDVWIPSAIKKGKGPESHHVYQVFIRVKTEEWNVYRRYAEFREFHQQIQRYLPNASTFNFPPKKTVGRKSSQVVEERRQRLQEYLRYIFKLCSTQALVPSAKAKEKSTAQQVQPIFPLSITKAKLIDLFPFFKEDSVSEVNSHHPSPNRTYSGL